MVFKIDRSDLENGNICISSQSLVKMLVRKLELDDNWVIDNNKYIIKYPNAGNRARHESGTLIEDKKTKDKVYLFYALKRLLAEGKLKDNNTPDGTIIIDGGLGKITLSTASLGTHMAASGR